MSEEKRKPGRPKGARSVFSLQSQPEAWTDKWYPGLRARLGITSDTELGVEYGVAAKTVSTIRNALGIPRYIRRSAAVIE